MFTAVDIRGECRGGAPKYPGQTSQREGRVEMSAHGSEFGHHCGEDQGHFAFVEARGDFDVSVQVAALSNGGAQRYDGRRTPAKGGIMAREGTDPGDRYVAIWAVSNDALDHYPDGYHFDARLDPGAWLGSKPEGRFAYGWLNRRRHGHLFFRNYPEVWLRLKRAGNEFSSFISMDGKSWIETSIPSFEVAMPETVVLGLGLSSSPEGDRNALSHAVFQNAKGFEGEP